MSDQNQAGERGAAEENTGVPDTEEEHDASPATHGDEDFRADGAAEEATGVDRD